MSRHGASMRMLSIGGSACSPLVPLVSNPVCFAEYERKLEMMSWKVLWLKMMNKSSCLRSRLPLYSCSEGIGSLMAVCLTELCARGWLFPGLHHFNVCFMVMFCEHPLSPPSSLYRYQRLLRFWRTDLFLLCRGAVVLVLAAH